MGSLAIFLPLDGTSQVRLVLILSHLAHNMETPFPADIVFSLMHDLLSIFFLVTAISFHVVF